MMNLTIEQISQCKSDKNFIKSSTKIPLKGRPRSTSPQPLEAFGGRQALQIQITKYLDKASL